MTHLFSYAIRFSGSTFPYPSQYPRSVLVIPVLLVLLVLVQRVKNIRRCTSIGKKKWLRSGVERVKAKAEIYTLGEGPWRNLGTVPFLLRNDSFYASLKGAFHWLTSECRSPDFIRCFNFDSEQLRVVHGPPEFDIHKKKFWNLFWTGVTHVSLDVLRGSLSICDFPSQFCVEVWMMKDYGIKESWTKEFVIENGICSRRYGLLYMVEPIMILASGEILMLVNRRSLVQYNPKLGSLKNLNIYGFKSGFYAAGYIPSFVSLRDAAKGERLTHLSASTGRNLRFHRKENLASMDELLQNLKDKLVCICVRRDIERTIVQLLGHSITCAKPVQAGHFLLV